MMGGLPVGSGGASPGAAGALSSPCSPPEACPASKSAALAGCTKGWWI
jgi:hypothetical protein